jgi:hypothetical protein
VRRTGGEGGGLGPHFEGDRVRATVVDGALEGRLFARLKPLLPPVCWSSATAVRGTATSWARAPFACPGTQPATKIQAPQSFTLFMRDAQHVGFYTLLLY